MSVLKDVFYSKKFQDETPEKQQQIVKDLKTAFEGDAKVLNGSEYIAAKTAFENDLAQKMNEVMGTPLPKHDNLIKNPLEKNPPKNKEELIARGKKLVNKFDEQQHENNLRSEDQPIEDESLIVAFPMAGAVKAGMGVATGSKTAIQEGLNFAKSDIAAQTAASGASKIIDEGTSDKFKQSHPNYYTAMQLLGTLVAGGTAGVYAYKNPTIERFAKIHDEVNQGIITPDEAEKATVDATKIAGNDIENAKKFIEETAQPKVSKEFTTTSNKQQNINQEIITKNVEESIPAASPEIKADIVKRVQKKLNRRQEEIQAAKEIPIGGSEDEAKQNVKNLFKKNTSEEAKYKNMSKDDIAYLEEQHKKELKHKDLEEIKNKPKQDNNSKYTKQDYSKAYDALTTDKKTVAGTQNSLDLEGTQKALFDTTAKEEYIVPSWAKPLVSDTTKYKDIIKAVTDAKNGKPSQLANRAVEAIKKSEMPKMNKRDWEEANQVFAKGIDNLAAGTIAGIGQDDNGNITFDPEKFIIGLGGYTAVKAALKSGAVRGKLKDYAKRAIDYVDMNPQVHKERGFNAMVKGGQQSSKETLRVEKEKKGLLKINAELKAKSIKPKGKIIFDPISKKDYIIGDDGKVYYDSNRGWRETKQFGKKKELEKINKLGEEAYLKSKEKIVPNIEKAKLPEEYKSLNEDTKEFVKRAIPKKEELQKHTNRYIAKKPPLPKKIFRGIKQEGYERKGGGAKEGLGLYTTVDKKLASNYGKVIEMNPKTDLPKKPLQFSGMNEFEIWEQQIPYILGYRRKSEMGNVSLNEIIYSINPEVDGIQIGKGVAQNSGNYWVKFPKIETLRVKKTNIKIQTSPTIGSALLGSTAGVEIDDKWNINYNLAKGVAGALAGAAGYRLSKKLFQLYKRRGQGFPISGLPDETLGEMWQRVFQDKFNRVKQLQKVKAGKKEISDALDVYRAEERYSGISQYKVAKFQKERVDPLLKYMAAKNINIDDLDEYLKARHAFERNAQMKKVSGIEDGSGMSNKKAAQIINKFKDNKDINELANEVYKINKDRLRLIKKEGLESDEYINDIEKMYSNYVPLKRDMSDKNFNQKGNGTGQGFSIKGKEIKRAKGSHREVESPFLHSILDYQQTLVRAEKNNVGKTFLKFINKYPDEDLYNVKSLNYSPVYDKEGNIRNMHPEYEEGDNIFHVKIDGKIKQITIKDIPLAIALKNLNQTQLNKFMQVSQKAVRTLASLNTMYNPEFVVSNFERDLQEAMINLPAEAKPKYASFLKDIPKSIRGIYRNERGKELTTEYQKLFEEMQANGGTAGWLDQFEVPELKTNLENTIKMYQGKNMPAKAFKDTLKYIDDVNTAVENGVRLVAYKQARDAGLTAKKAASIAKNLTINFNRKGTAGPFLNIAYMFYNASIQGSARLMKTLSTSPRARVAVGGIIGIGYGLHQYNMMMNKDAYSKIPDYIKNTNYIFMKKDGTFYKMKLPYGYNVFKVLGDITAEMQDGTLSPEKAKSRFLSALANSFNPIGASGDPVTMFTPTLAKPFYEMKTNENFFGGKIKPEASPYEPNPLSESHTYFKSVNPVAKKFAAELNDLTGGTKYTRGTIDISPEYIEHLAAFVGGGLSKLAINTETTAQNIIEGEKVDINKVPFLRQFKGKNWDKVELMRAYDLYKKSGRNILSNYDSKQFKKYITEAIRKKDIPPKKGFTMIKKFRENQSKAKWSKRKNIQSKKDAKENLNSLIRIGGSKTDIKNILLNK